MFNHNKWKREYNPDESMPKDDDLLIVSKNGQLFEVLYEGDEGLYTLNGGYFDSLSEVDYWYHVQKIHKKG